jgi:hypothetical protein
VNPGDLSERFKERAQFRFRRLKIHVTDKHVLHDYLSFKKWESKKARGINGRIQIAWRRR